MFEKKMYQCPSCSTEIREELSDCLEFKCRTCNMCYQVMLDKKTGKAGFFNVDDKNIPEPLYLPKGSIRSMMTIAMAISCWGLIFRGMEVPNYLFSLILTIIGYYFGFRKKIKTADSKIYDASAKEQLPLLLPHGFIRFFLISGFLISCVFLYNKGSLKTLKYLEFFVVLFGLILGYIFARVLAGSHRSTFYVFINHIKGLVVISTASLLVYLFFTGGYIEKVYFSLGLSSVISFYFGSRS
ncbi:MAG: hypothetical protein KAI43_05965 [Candidatus Aureabacteria bacterium]|nr:hypothetical protein [Candidatus Auribacterota bacterium]